MMEFKPGDAVINPSMPQWGVGEVLDVSEGKVLVKFPRYGVRKVFAPFLALASTGECPDPMPKPAPKPTAKASGLVAEALAMMEGKTASPGSPAGDSDLDRAERAADLASDARQKAREDRERLLHAAILRFWRDAEVFLIPEVPRSSNPPVTRARRWETVSPSLPAWSASRDGDDIEAALFSRTEGAPLPWTLPLPNGFAAAWHIVYLGVLPRQRISDIILENTGSEAERPEEPGSGDGCMAAVVLDSTGRPLGQSYVPASFVPGLARCLAGKGLDQLPMDMLKMQSAFDRRADARDEPFSGPWMQEEIQALFETAGVEGEEPRIVVRSVYYRPDPKGRRIEDVQNDLLNSFFLNDLDRLLSLSRLGFRGAFRRWLGEGTDEARRVDLLSRSEAGNAAFEHALSAGRIPRGRWPFPADQHMLPAQLGAVTEILNGELTAVNGPPGTGKTRLLCDVAADLVVQRAWRVAQCRQPFDVFTTSSGDFYPLREDIMRGTCMVAVSSNNAAVENITRFLPSQEAVCLDDFPEASYFPGPAAAVDAAFSPPDREDGRTRPVWGLMAAVLGSAWNCDQFARAFLWGYRDQEKKISLPGMKQELDPFREYEGKQKAREGWRRAKQDFLRTASELEERREALEARAKGGQEPAPKTEAVPDMLSQFLKLAAQSKAMKEAEAGSAASELAGRLDGLEELIRRAQEEMEARKADSPVPLRTPCRGFRDDPDWQLKSVWNDGELSRLRTRLFLQALRLHEWTVKACAREFTANIGAIVRHLRGDIVEEAEVAEIWDALFFMVPVVSSTLASFSRLFSGMGAASLDWVLMDEAGQAAPQSAAGALWRAKRAAVIGDPQQIEPVVPQPASLLDTLRGKLERDGISLDPWSPDRQSAQTLADRNSERGTWMDCAGRRVWTGFPLRAHHRCAEPMFGVANRIAYDSQMVQARRRFAEVSSPLGSSRWLHVNGHVADSQLVREELACLRRCLLAMQGRWPVVRTGDAEREATVFVISPFRKVAWHCRALAQSLHLPEERVRCGTIHTFQGREADIVFLVLGSSPGTSGWGSRQWASRTPNILNVALTRARSLVYVIGNHRDWRRHPFFSILAEEMPVVEGGDGSGAEALWLE